MACLVSLTVKVSGVDHKLPENVHTFKKIKKNKKCWMISLTVINYTFAI